MKVIIPVAGIGTRLKPHTLTLPKPLLHIAGKTILDYLLAPITRLNPAEVVFVTGYKGDMIESYVRKSYSFKATFVRQDRLLGLGYALHMALGELDDGPLLVLLGDTIVECDLKKFVTAGKYALGLHPVADPRRFGIAEISRGRVVNVEEKPKKPRGNLALIGLYYFSESERLKKELAALIDSGTKTRGEIQLTDALAAMMAGGIGFAPFEVKEWFDCGKKETMLATNRHLLREVSRAKPIHGSVVHSPAFIGEDVQIENSVIGPYVSVGSGTRIKNSIVTDSIIGREARLENLVVEKSIIGNNVVLKSEKKVLNIGDSTQITGC